MKKITVYRVLDPIKERFKLSKLYRDKVDVINIYTRPEIEMLVIISENKYDEFSRKYKNEIKASDYCKSVLKFNSVKSKTFLEKYYSDSDKLVKAIIEYQRLIKKDKHKTLADLLIKQ